jgi:hypothetical protein
MALDLLIGDVVEIDGRRYDAVSRETVDPLEVLVLQSHRRHT